MDIEGVVIFEAESGVPLYSKMKGKTDPTLFSSFVSAIGHFSKQLKFGGLSSFTTEEKVIFTYLMGNPEIPSVPPRIVPIEKRLKNIRPNASVPKAR